MSRISARENLMKLVFEYNCIKNTDEFLEDFFAETNLGDEDKQYIVESLSGIKNNYEDIVNIIESNLVNYKFDRVCKTDIAILMVAIYELKFLKMPSKIVINEAVELSKKYSTDNSYKFVNGLLAKVNNAI